MSTPLSKGFVAKIFNERKVLRLTLPYDHNKMWLKNYLQHNLKSWVDSMDFRPLILFHLTRFVGLLFLYLYSVGRLPSEFAVMAGWGDIFVAVTAIALVIAISFRRSSKLILIWNIIGLADILLVLITGARLGAGAPGLMAEFTRLPLSLLPTFVVPIVLSTHVFIFKKLFDRRKEYLS